MQAAVRVPRLTPRASSIPDLYAHVVAAVNLGTDCERASRPTTI